MVIVQHPLLWFFRKHTRLRWDTILHSSDRLILCVIQACYGHTEGAAGITGLLLAMQSMLQRSAAGIMSLRDMNPYVSAAVADWAKQAGLAPMLPRQLCALSEISLAGMMVF